MPIDNDLSLVEERLIDAFNASLPAGIIAGNVKYPNGRFTTPNGEPWARIGLTTAAIPVDADASGCYEINEGLFNVGLFWPKGTGSQDAMQAAHQVKELYDANNFDDVKILSSVVSPAPEGESSAWYGVNINMTYQYEGYRT